MPAHRYQAQRKETALDPNKGSGAFSFALVDQGEIEMQKQKGWRYLKGA